MTDPEKAEREILGEKLRRDERNGGGGTLKHGQHGHQWEGEGENVMWSKWQDEAGSRKKKLFQQESLNYACSFSFRDTGGQNSAAHLCVCVC